MAAHPPPVPPEQRSHKGPGEPAGKPVDQKDEFARKKKRDEKTGRYGAVQQNTTNQGYQQDR